MKPIILSLIGAFFFAFQVSAQNENYPVSEMKLAAKSRDGKFYDYFLIAVKDADTFQVIQVTGKHKTKDRHQFEPAMFAVFDFKQGKPIDKKSYSNYMPFIKRKVKAYFIDRVGLIYF